jgi:regulator of protease activity HflC (stomatin/prohibitin superfamily)
MMPGERKGERFGIIGAVVQAIGAVAFYLFAGNNPETESSFLWQCGHLAAAASVLAGIAAMHAYLRRTAADEESEEEAAGSQRQLFDNELDGIGRRRAACRQFEKRLLPILAGTVALGLAAASAATIRALVAGQAVGDGPVQPLLTVAAVSAVLAIACFVVGKFVNAVAFGDGQATLRPVGGELLLMALVTAGAAVSALILYWDQAGVARVFGWIVAFLGVGLGLERLALLIVDVYRPQQKSGPEVPVYESRLLGIFTQPEGAVRNLAEIIRYQFGITLDERVLGQFLRRVALPFGGAQVLVLAVLSTLVYVQPHETALVQGTARAELEVLDAGLYWRLPWPFTRVTRVPSGRLQTVSIMPIALTAETDPDSEPPAIGWADKRFSKELFLAASAATSEDLSGTPVNLAAAAVDVRYRVADPQLYFTSQGDPQAVLRLVSRREVSRYLMEHDLPELLARGRTAMEQGLLDRINAAAKDRKLGISVESVGMPSLHPPPQVAAVWEGVTQARADAGRLLVEAETFAVTRKAGATAVASTLVTEAQAATVRATKMAEAEAATYGKLRPVHAAYPELLETRAAMDAVEVWLRDARKVIVAADRDREVITLELKKVRPDLLEGFDQ